MTIRETFEIVSLGLTPVMLSLSIIVVCLWGSRAIKSVGSGQMKEIDWLILGIVISFIGKFGDNLWWGFAWHASHTGSDSKWWWFNNGVFSNTIFRQGCGIVAAICHLQAALTVRNLATLCGAATLIGLVYALTLIAI